jgi:hypothetical protein
MCNMDVNIFSRLGTVSLGLGSRMCRFGLGRGGCLRGSLCSMWVIRCRFGSFGNRFGIIWFFCC